MLSRPYPFRSGLGKKESGEFFGNWWAAVDTKNRIALRQKLSGDGWAEPVIWFGQGHYNVELATEHGFEIAPGKTWETELHWSLHALGAADLDTFLNSLR
jgi:hypothetical protein